MKKSKRRAARRAAGASRPGLARRWSQERRLEFIDFRLRWERQLNRRDLTEFFGISVPQASLDIARYAELAPRNLEYDRGCRTYLASGEFRSLYDENGPGAFLDELLSSTRGGEPERCRLGSRPALAVAPSPGRNVNGEVLAALHHAISAATGLSVTYQSLTRPEPVRRILSPHAFVYDGQRWRVRAYCHARHGFRDFIITRILEVHGPAPRGLGPELDTSWNEMVDVVLAPHPDLPLAHRRAVELDYGMVDGRVTLRFREALLSYVLERLHVGRGDRETPEVQHVVVANAEALAAHRTGAEKRVA